MKKISVITIDDHKLVQELWLTLFNGNREIDVVGQGATAAEAIELVSDKKPDIVLLDINLSKGSGFDAVQQILAISPASKIIAVSMHDQPGYVKKMLNLGARGYVTKNSSQEEIIKAFTIVMSGRVYVCEEIRNIVTKNLLDSESEEPDIKMLTSRELEIARYVREGYASKDIALKLGIAVKTVETTRYNILKKLKLKNTPSLINLINRNYPHL